MKLTRLLAALAAVSLIASTEAVTITPALVGGSGDVDNVLFNQGVLDSGLTVMGTFNSNPTYMIRFTSTQPLEVNGGQASLSGQGDSNFTNLSFSLVNGDTFTKAQLNPDASTDGTITFTVTYINPNGTLGSQSFSLNGNGQNYFTILAENTQRITTVSFVATGTQILDSGQFRLGGLQRATTVPDGGATVALLGASLIALVGLRRKFV